MKGQNSFNPSLFIRKETKMEDNKIQWKIRTTIPSEAIIEQEIVNPTGNIVRQLYDLEESQIQAALIKMGWTPPNPDKRYYMIEREMFDDMPFGNMIHVYNSLHEDLRELRRIVTSNDKEAISAYLLDIATTAMKAREELD